MKRQVYQVRNMPDELKARIAKAAKKEGVPVWQRIQKLMDKWESGNDR